MANEKRVMAPDFKRNLRLGCCKFSCVVTFMDLLHFHNHSLGLCVEMCRSGRAYAVAPTSFAITRELPPYAEAFWLCWKKASRSALISSGFVVHIPWGKPG